MRLILLAEKEFDVCCDIEVRSKPFPKMLFGKYQKAMKWGMISHFHL